MSSLQNQWFSLGGDNPSYELQGKTYAQLNVEGNSVKSIELIPDNFITLNSSTSVVPSENKTGSYITIINPIVGHKVYAKITTSNPNLRLCWYKSGTTAYDFVTGELLDSSSTVSNVFEGVYTVTQDMVYSDGYMQFYYWIYNGLPTGNHTLTVQLIDLTELDMDSIINPVLFNATELGKLMSKRLVGFGSKIYSVDKDLVLSNGNILHLTEPLRSVGDVKDSYSTSGKEIRRLAEVDLGSLNWYYDGNTKKFYNNEIVDILDASYSYAIIGDVMSSKYIEKGFGNFETATTVEGMARFRKYIYIRDLNYTDTITFKSAMQGIKLIYELATPIETKSDLLELPSDTTILNAEYSKELKSIEFPVYANPPQLPDEYQEVEYLESTGTQWIDSGWIPNNKTKFTIKNAIMIDGSSSVLAGHGLGSGYGNSRCVIGTSSNGNHIVYYGINNVNYEGLSTTFQYEKGIPFIASIDLKNNKYSFNGIEKSSSTLPPSATSTIYLFARHNAPSKPVDMSASQRLYWCTIEEDGIIVRQFIPCYRKSDNVAGMYDLVNGVFYTNQGTGSFIVGNDVNTDIEIAPKRRTKNLFDISKVITRPNFLINNGNGTLTVKSGNYSGTGLGDNKLKDFCPELKVGDIATLKFISGGQPYIYLYGSYNSTWSTNQTKTITQAMLDDVVLFYNTSGTQPNDIVISNIQIELGSTATAYEPYYDYLTELKQVGDIKDTYTTLNGSFNQKTKSFTIEKDDITEIRKGNFDDVYFANTNLNVTDSIKTPLGKITGISSYGSLKTNAQNFNYPSPNTISTGYDTINKVWVGLDTQTNWTVDKVKNLMPADVIYELAEPTKTKYNSYRLKKSVTKFVDKNGVEVEYSKIR